MTKPISRREFLQRAAASVSAASSALLLSACRETPDAPSPETGNSESMGQSRGLYPGRVVWAYDPAATPWDGKAGFWWQPKNTHQAVVNDMFSQSLCQLTGQTKSADAWAALFHHFNAVHKGTESGYRPGEQIAIKVNLNTCTKHNMASNHTFTSPHVLLALLKQLVTVAGVPSEDITVYDAVRYVPDCIYDYCRLSELEGTHFVDFEGGDGREASQRDVDNLVHWSIDVGGNPTYLPTCVTWARYLINLAQLKGHNLCGVTLCAKNHLGTIMADLDGKPVLQSPQGANIHGYIAAHDFDYQEGWRWPQRAMGTYNALVDLMGHRHLGEKTLLFMIDGLYAAPNQQGVVDNTTRWQSAPFDDGWASSLFLSQDGVAIDSVALDFIRNEPVIASNANVMPPGSTCENYMHEAARADEPASGTLYAPNGDDKRLPSLGVHEHWNDPGKRQYSRNLGHKEGIELLEIL